MTDTTDTPLKRAAKAIYAELPNGAEVTVRTTAIDQDGSARWGKRFVPDPWEQAPDRHEDCLRQARAALTAALKVRWNEAGDDAYLGTICVGYLLNIGVSPARKFNWVVSGEPEISGIAETLFGAQSAVQRAVIEAILGESL